MGLNKPSGNMYPGFWTWNGIAGCLFNCTYCYLHDKRLNFDSTPRLVEARFKDNLSKHGAINIFVGSSGDAWGNHIPSEWISRVLEYCKRFRQNTYLFQTKNPQRFIPFINDLPANTILAVTIETDWNGYSYSEAPSPRFRQVAFNEVRLRSEGRYKTMVSIEPIIWFTGQFGAFLLEMDANIYSIGADSQHSGLKEPSPDCVAALIKELRQAKKEVRLKNNLKRLLKDKSQFIETMTEIKTDILPKQLYFL